MKHKNKFKSVISLLLSVAMIMSVVPMTTFAAQSNEYVDPADNWLNSNGRTNELDVVVVNSDLYDAMKQLPQDKLNIILHSYFLGKTDQEIANEAKVVQSTVCRRRQKILELLKELIAEEGG